MAFAPGTDLRRILPAAPQLPIDLGHRLTRFEPQPGALRVDQYRALRHHDMRLIAEQTHVEHRAEVGQVKVAGPYAEWIGRVVADAEQCLASQEGGAARVAGVELDPASRPPSRYCCRRRGG